MLRRTYQHQNKQKIKASRISNLSLAAIAASGRFPNACPARKLTIEVSVDR
jgi:hypothetical protein